MRCSALYGSKLSQHSVPVALTQLNCVCAVLHHNCVLQLPRLLTEVYDGGSVQSTCWVDTPDF
jgi:hypothetical protein